MVERLLAAKLRLFVAVQPSKVREIFEDLQEISYCGLLLKRKRF